MHMDQGEWILNEGEMAAVAAAFGLRNATLGVLPDKLPAGQVAEDAVRAFGALDPAFRALAERCLRALADPGKRVHFHSTVADDQVSRCLLAYSPDMGGAWVSLARSGDLRRVSLRSEPELRLLVADTLAANDSLRPDRIAVNLSTPEALALLAAFDQLRRARFISLLNHNEPVTLSPRRTCRRAWRRPRWRTSGGRSPFLCKLLPLPLGRPCRGRRIHGRPSWRSRRPAFSSASGTSGERVLCELTNAGAFLEAGFRECSAKAALSVTVPLQGGVGSRRVFCWCARSSTCSSCPSAGRCGALHDSRGRPRRDLQEHLCSSASGAPAHREWDQAVGQGTEATVILNGPTLALACLVVDSGPLAGKAFTLTHGLTLGRQADNDIAINDPGASRRHARFTRDAKGVWSVEDLGSSNGCFVNETRIEGTHGPQAGDCIA